MSEEHQVDWKEIAKVMKAYRDFLSEAEVGEQKAHYWHDQNKFIEVVEPYVEMQLADIQRVGLLGELDKESFSDLNELHDKAHAAIEERKVRVIEDKLGEYTSNVSYKMSPHSGYSQSSHENDVKLSDLLKEFVAKRHDQDQAWRQKTKEKTESHFWGLINVLGDISIHEVNEDSVRRYTKHLELRTVLRGGVKKPISNLTKNDHLNSCTRVFEFAMAIYSGIERNPFSNRSLRYDVGAKQKRERVVFSDEDLKKIFSHRVFGNGEFLHPYMYWIPLLGLYTGCRENELCQLHTSDVQKAGDFYILNHQLNNDKKRIKTNEERLTPIHPKLVELGFIEFVELLKTKNYQGGNRLGDRHLFDGLSYSSRDGFKKNFSRWFNGGFDPASSQHKGFKFDCDLEFDANKRKDFHSFRHTLSTALKHAGVPNDKSYEITGHRMGGIESVAGDGYRKGYPIDTLYQEMLKLNFDGVLINVKPFFEVCNKKRLIPKKELKS